MGATDYFSIACDLVPEAWFLDILEDAISEGYELVMLATASTGLHIDVIQRVLDHCNAREGDDDWHNLSHGQQLDECFPDYHGIGSWELLDELGLTSVYVGRAGE
ncbi:MAG: hypothetical protein WBA05_02395 [Gordonia sp. (in: high G+C Gram-positive bacteria)]|uniref:hypothetical protein n=1 Tax=Gordonia sp. (in: high G+C Gram-positive bacteria) TaxID=84139 RepID=UPI003C744804